MKSLVAIQRCSDYEEAAVEAALFAACDAAGFPDPRGMSVLFKPNILMAAEPERAVSTHPAVLRAAIRYAKAKGAARVLVGESPGFQVGNQAFRKSGLLEVAAQEGAEWADFGDGVQVDNPSGKLVKNFTVARAAVEADLLVSLCKLKNHNLMYFTGAMKNLFGCVPGLQKAQFHLRFPERERFAAMLVDLNLALRGDFAIMDAVVGMEGPGPSSGTPRRIGALLASSDLLAVDRAACRIIGLDPRLVPSLEEARGRGVWASEDEDIEVAGAKVEDLLVRDWKQVPRGHESARWVQALRFRSLFVPKPYFSRKRCVACGACVAICPAKALELVPDERARKGRRIEVDYSKCIRCYCCDEVCPEKAVAVRRARPIGFA